MKTTLQRRDDGSHPVLSHNKVWPGIACWLGLVLLVINVQPATARPDTGTFTLDAAGTLLQVYAYRPPQECRQTDVLVVFHGLNRKAAKLRDKAKPVARRACLTVFAPLFDKARFPNWRYHRAGVFRDGEVQPESLWTGPILQALLDQLPALAGNPAARIYLFGHSAGGQFLSRIAAYSPPGNVTRIIIANPSLHVLPLPEEPVPIGFAGLSSELQTRRWIKDYLAQPVTIYLGREDTGSKYLVKSPAAMRRGKTRLERGRDVFRTARQLARDKGWPFNWHLVEVPGVGHSSRGMLQAAELLTALDLSSVTEPHEATRQTGTLKRDLDQPAAAQN